MNQELIYIRLNEDHKFERITDSELCFDTFINGFKLILINSESIKSVYVNDTILRSSPIKNDLKHVTQSFIDCIDGRYDLVIGSDIHLHCFQLQLMIELSHSDRIGRVVFAGDILFKTPYEEQRPSVKKATDAISKILTDNLPFIYEADVGQMTIKETDLTAKDKIVWVTGNHDKETSVPPTCTKLKTLLEHLAFIYDADVGDYHFRIQHGVLEDDYDPRLTQSEDLSEKFSKYMTGNNYLILGHNWHYCRYKNEDIIKRYEDIHKHHVFRIGIGKYELTDEYVEDGPEYIIPGSDQSKFSLLFAFDLDQQCVQANINKRAHVLCTDNIRAVTPINLSDEECPYEMFGGKKSKQKCCNLVLCFLIIVLVILIVVVYLESHPTTWTSFINHLRFDVHHIGQ